MRKRNIFQTTKLANIFLNVSLKKADLVSIVNIVPLVFEDCAQANKHLPYERNSCSHSYKVIE